MKLKEGLLVKGGMKAIHCRCWSYELKYKVFELDAVMTFRSFIYRREIKY